MNAMNDRSWIYDRTGKFDLLQSVKSAVNAFSEALSCLLGSKAALPLLFYLGFKILILFLYLASTTEPWNNMWALLMRGVSGAFISRYPVHLIFMQTILGRLDIVLDIFVHVIFLGATISLVANASRRTSSSLGLSFKKALRKYPQLVTVTFLTSLVILVCIYAPGYILGEIPGIARLAAAAATTLVGLVVQAFLLYSIPIILLGKASVFRAIAESITFAWRTITTTYLIVFLPFLLTLPTMLLGFSSEMIALRLSPDLIKHIYIANELMHFISSFLKIGGAVIFYLERKKHEAVDAR
jgi:hypothetical protein